MSLSNKSHFFSFKLIGFQSCLILIYLGCFLGGFTYLNDRLYHQRIYNNISISDINVSGLSIDEATLTLQAEYLTPLLDKQLIFSFDDAKFQFYLRDFILSSNLEEIITEALSYSQKLSVIQKLAFLQDSTPSVNFPLQTEFNQLAILDHIDTLINENFSLPQNASISIDQSGTLLLIPHKNGAQLNQSALSHALSTYLNRLKTSDMPLIHINLDDYLTIIPSDIVSEDLSLINTRVASYSTNFNPSSPSSTNIQIAASALDGILLMPNSVFSFNEAIGDTTYDKGYVDAPVIVNGEYVSGVGGGVCQVSSTLYNSILSIGLLASERKPHSRPSSYVPMGLDAAISWDYIDLKFTNTFDYPLYINAYTTERSLHIDLYSHKDLTNVTYNYISEIYEVISPKVEYIPSHLLPLNTTQLARKGSTGYKVKVTKETYNKDQLIDSQVISWDTYRAYPTIYHVGS